MLDGGSAWLSMLGVVVVFILILILAYWCTRFVASNRLFRSVGGMQGSGRLRILEQLPMGKDQKLVIVQMGTRCFALGVTAQNISVLAQWTGEEAEEWLQEPGGTGEAPAPDFKKAIMDVLQSRKKR